MTKWSYAKDAVKEAVASASDHAADDAGMLEALISVALTTLAEIKGVTTRKISSTTKRLP